MMSSQYYLFFIVRLLFAFKWVNFLAAVSDAFVVRNVKCYTTYVKMDMC